MRKLTFNEAKSLVRRLVAEKGFPNNEQALPQKLLWAFVELGEAADAYKKGKDWKLGSRRTDGRHLLHSRLYWAG